MRVALACLVPALGLATLALGAVRAAEAPGHELRAGGAVTLAKGARASASVSIVPLAGRRVDGGSPLVLRVSVDPPEGLELVKRRYALADAADPRADAPRFEIAFTGAAAGAYTLAVEARFWLCGARVCRPVRDTVKIPVTVAAPAPPPAAPSDAGP